MNPNDRSILSQSSGGQSVKSSCERAALPLKALGEDLSLHLSASSGPRYSLACGHLTTIFASVLIWQSSLCQSFLLPGSCKDIWQISFVMRFWSHLDNLVWLKYQDPWNNYISKDCFLNKVTFTGSRGEEVDIYLERPLFKPLLSYFSM